MNTSPESLDTPRFPTKAALAAAQLTQALFHKWSRGGVKPIDAEKGDKPVAGGRGKQNLYTFRGVLRLAVTAELAGWGLPPAKALAAAREFTDLDAGPPAGYAVKGETPAERHDRLRQRPDYREPGGLFSTGRTLLVVDRDGNAEVVNLTPGDELEISSRSAIVIDMADFCRRIEAALAAAAPEKGR